MIDIQCDHDCPQHNIWAHVGGFPLPSQIPFKRQGNRAPISQGAAQHWALWQKAAQLGRIALSCPLLRHPQMLHPVG